MKRKQPLPPDFFRRNNAELPQRPPGTVARRSRPVQHLLRSGPPPELTKKRKPRKPISRMPRLRMRKRVPWGADWGQVDGKIEQLWCDTPIMRGGCVGKIECGCDLGGDGGEGGGEGGGAGGCGGEGGCGGCGGEGGCGGCDGCGGEGGCGAGAGCDGCGGCGGGCGGCGCGCDAGGGCEGACGGCGTGGCSTGTGGACASADAGTEGDPGSADPGAADPGSQGFDEAGFTGQDLGFSAAPGFDLGTAFASPDPGAPSAAPGAFAGSLAGPENGAFAGPESGFAGLSGAFAGPESGFSAAQTGFDPGTPGFDLGTAFASPDVQGVQGLAPSDKGSLADFAGFANPEAAAAFASTYGSIVSGPETATEAGFGSMASALAATQANLATQETAEPGSQPDILAEESQHAIDAMMGPQAAPVGPQAPGPNFPFIGTGMSGEQDAANTLTAENAFPTESASPDMQGFSQQPDIASTSETSPTSEFATTNSPISGPSSDIGQFANSNFDLPLTAGFDPSQGIAPATEQPTQAVASSGQEEAGPGGFGSFSNQPSSQDTGMVLAGLFGGLGGGGNINVGDIHEAQPGPGSPMGAFGPSDIYGETPSLQELSPSGFGREAPSNLQGPEMQPLGGRQEAALDTGTRTDAPIGGPSSNLYAAATGETTQLPSDEAGKETIAKETGGGEVVELPEVTVTPDKAETDVAGASAAGEERGSAARDEGVRDQGAPEVKGDGENVTLSDKEGGGSRSTADKTSEEPNVSRETSIPGSLAPTTEDQPKAEFQAEAPETRDPLTGAVMPGKPEGMQATNPIEDMASQFFGALAPNEAEARSRMAGADPNPFGAPPRTQEEIAATFHPEIAAARGEMAQTLNSNNDLLDRLARVAQTEQGTDNVAKLTAFVESWLNRLDERFGGDVRQILPGSADMKTFFPEGRGTKEGRDWDKRYAQIDNPAPIVFQAIENALNGSNVAKGAIGNESARTHSGERGGKSEGNPGLLATIGGERFVGETASGAAYGAAMREGNPLNPATSQTQLAAPSPASAPPPMEVITPAQVGPSQDMFAPPSGPSQDMAIPPSGPSQDMFAPSSGPSQDMISGGPPLLGGPDQLQQLIDAGGQITSPGQALGPYAGITGPPQPQALPDWLASTPFGAFEDRRPENSGEQGWHSPSATPEDVRAGFEAVQRGYSDEGRAMVGLPPLNSGEAVSGIARDLGSTDIPGMGLHIGEQQGPQFESELGHQFPGGGNDRVYDSLTAGLPLFGTGGDTLQPGQEAPGVMSPEGPEPAQPPALDLSSFMTQMPADTFDQRFGNLPPAGSPIDQVETGPHELFPEAAPGWPLDMPLNPDGTPAGVASGQFPDVPYNPELFHVGDMGDRATGEFPEERAGIAGATDADTEKFDLEAHPLGSAAPQSPGERPTSKTEAERAVDLFDKADRAIRDGLKGADRQQADKYAAFVTKQDKIDLVTGKISSAEFMARVANREPGIMVTRTPEMIQQYAADRVASLEKTVAGVRGEAAKGAAGERAAQQEFEGKTRDYATARSDYEARLGKTAEGFDPGTPMVAPSAPEEPPPQQPGGDYTIPGAGTWVPPLEPPSAPAGETMAPPMDVTGPRPDSGAPPYPPGIHEVAPPDLLMGGQLPTAPSGPSVTDFPFVRGSPETLGSTSGAPSVPSAAPSVPPGGLGSVGTNILPAGPPSFSGEGPSPAYSGGPPDPATRIAAHQLMRTQPELVQQVAQMRGITLAAAALLLAQSMPHMAGGGQAQAEQPIVVGEHGPEVFTPDVPGTIAPPMSILPPPAALAPGYERMPHGMPHYEIFQGMHFSPSAWDDWLASRPYSENIEDRRNENYIKIADRPKVAHDRDRLKNKGRPD